MPHVPSRRPLGFTLIELLTVIAIIGILAAILIPTVGAVRLSAQKTASLSNLRQIGAAFALFANDNRGRFPGAGINSDTRWNGQLERYLIKSGTSSYNSPIIRSPLVPVAAYQPAGSSHGMYGYNDNLSLRPTQPSSLLGLLRSEVRNPSRTILAASKNWRSHETNAASGPQLNATAPFPRQPHGVAANYRADRDPSAAPDGSGAAAYLYVDGHVAMLANWPGVDAFDPTK
jgi:prepilin-type N-terminal cleavage/methylation domain-containing protein/prepilin-type processing-associated H-X9-DG protein